VTFDEVVAAREYSLSGEYDRELNEVELDEVGEVRRYEGEFQKPDSRELLGIGLSIAGVGILALAAGLTTVLNWVL
jgi:hypothetical protein